MKVQMTLTAAQVQEIVDFADEYSVENFFIAKDSGAYLGITAKGEDGELKRILHYFKGCNPETDEDYYENADMKFGGDDFGESLPVKAFRDALKVDNLEKVMVLVRKTTVAITPFAAKKSAPKATPKVKNEEEAVKALEESVEKNKEKAKKGTKKMGVGAYAMECIMDGYSNEEVVEMVLEKFPSAKTSKASVAWYRSKMKKDAEAA